MVKTAQLGLAHSYSRAKVKFNVNRADNMIIQSINLLDKLDKDINTFAMRVRYATHSLFAHRVFLFVRSDVTSPSRVHRLIWFRFFDGNG